MYIDKKKKSAISHNDSNVGPNRVVVGGGGCGGGGETGRLRKRRVENEKKK